jgi:predicted RNase H-like nuclease (RuvC/YqgF family)
MEEDSQWTMAKFLEERDAKRDKAFLTEIEFLTAELKDADEFIKELQRDLNEARRELTYLGSFDS